MDDLPSGWGLEMGVAPSVKTAKTSRARPSRKDGKKKQTEAKKAQVVIDLEKNKEKKRKEVPEAVDTVEGALSKKNKSSSFSLVSAALSPLAIPFVNDEDIVKWRNRDPSTENEAIIKASSEILISALHRQSVLQKEEARLEAVEREKNKLSKKVEDRDRIIDKLKNELRSKESFYESELKVQEEVSNDLNSTINTLREEKEGWIQEKKKIEKASFKDGFRNYASGFLAQDPDYDFTKFGEETVAWIAKFKTEEAESIKAKRVFLGLEAASPVPDEESEDASSDGIPDHTFGDAPFNESAPDPTKAPENSQVVEKLNDQTQDAS